MDKTSHLDIDDDACFTKENLAQEISRLHAVHKRERLLSLALLAMNGVLVLCLYLFTPSVDGWMTQFQSPSDTAYRLQPKLMVATDQRTIQRPSQDPRVEAAIWTSAVSLETGFVWIENADEPGLPPGLPSTQKGERKMYGLTWGHQTHCLMMIRNEYQALGRNASNLIYGVDGLEAAERARLHHIDHCFHYLRETIGCTRDMTVEWAADYPDELGNPHHIDGYGVPHQCRNVQRAEDFVKDHQPGLADGSVVSSHHVFGR